jgi:hypothetical protein
MGLGCLGMLAMESEAAITFSNPVRSVSASNNKGSSQEIISNDIGQFNESAGVDWVDYFDHVDYRGITQNITSRYDASATQDSIIGLTGISAKGVVQGTGDWVPIEGRYHQYSNSYFKVNISLERPSNLYLKGGIKCSFDTEAYDYVWPDLHITLSSADGDVYSRNFFDDLTDYQAFELDESFISLDAGEYVFEMSVGSRAETGGGDNNLYIVGYADTSYDITLVPEPSVMLLAGLGVALMRRKR